jgi:hypothetical protein
MKSSIVSGAPRWVARTAMNAMIPPNGIIAPSITITHQRPLSLHYALALSADPYNVATGFAVVCLVTSKVGKLSDFEFPVRAGRVNGAAILSELQPLPIAQKSCCTYMCTCRSQTPCKRS